MRGRIGVRPAGRADAATCAANPALCAVLGDEIAAGRRSEPARVPPAPRGPSCDPANGPYRHHPSSPPPAGWYKLPREPMNRRHTAFLSVSLLSVVIFTNMTTRAIFSPLLPLIEADLSISHTQAGSLFLLVSLGYFVSMLLSGFVSARLQHRRVILLSTFIAGGSLFVVASSTSLTELRLSLLLLGMGVGLYFPSGMATIAALVDRRNLGKAAALHEMGPAASFVLAPLMASALLGVTTWRGTVAGVGAGAIVVAFVFLLSGRGGRFLGAPPRLHNVRSILALPSLWIIAITSCLAAGAAIGVYSVLPLYLHAEVGMDVDSASRLLGLSRIAGMLMIPFGGWLTDRFGPRALMLGIGSVVGVLTMAVGLCRNEALVAAVFLQPVLISSFFPATMAALARIVPRETYNVAISTVVPFAFLFGSGMVPTLMGVLGDHANFALGFVLLGGALLASLILLPFLRIPRVEDEAPGPRAA